LPGRELLPQPAVQIGVARPFRQLIAVAGVMLAGCQASASDAGFPPLPGPSPDTEAVAVSAKIAAPGQPVFYVRDAQDSHRLRAYDWNGAFRGSLTVSASEPFGVYPSADGTVLLLQHAHILTGGRALGQLENGTWAGDNQRVCSFLNTKGGPGAPRSRQISANESQGIDTPGALFSISVTGERRKVLDYGAFGQHGGPMVLACNSASNRAVIAQSFTATMSQLEMVNLSDGKVVARDPRGSTSGPAGVILSADGSLLGSGSTWQTSSGQGTDAFTIYRLPSNELVRRVTGTGIRAFSADGRRILTVEYLNGSNQLGRYGLLDLSTGTSLWSAVLSPGTVLTRPGTGDFILGSWNYEPSRTRPNTNDAFEDVWLVPANGSARLILKHATPLG
jgi:hypothetical protein